MRSSRMKPGSISAGVDCTLSPLLPSSLNGNYPRNEFCSATAVTPTAEAVTGNPLNESPARRLVFNPDLPAHPLDAAKVSATKVNVDLPKSQQTSSARGVLQKIYRCTVCSEGFSQKSNLTTHLKTHAKESNDPYRCNYCGKTFAVPARLTRHYRTHTGEKPYQCEFCNKSFSVKENLSVHKRIHTKERPYKCDVCDRAFEHSGKLHRHMRIHTGERPHKCNYCSKTFIQSGQLVIHLRTHTGEKPYVCKSCNKGFTCSKQLKVHTRTHTGEKPYACDICGKSFGYNHVLKLHQVAHYGEKVYKCTICQQTFTSKKTMESHIKVSHSDSNVARTVAEGESSSGASSASDKENKIDVSRKVQYISPPARSSEPRVSPQPAASPIASEAAVGEPLPSCTAYDSYLVQMACTVPTPPTRSLSSQANTESTISCAGFYSHPTSRDQSTESNSALLVAAAATTQELVTSYQNMSSMQPHRSKFEMSTACPGYYAAVPSPSSCSDSTRSSPSPMLEIVEQVDDQSLYTMPGYSYLGYQCKNSTVVAAGGSFSSSVISYVPYTDGGLTPSRRSSTSPVPSSSDLLHLPVVREQLSLPIRKRTKMILKSMESNNVVEGPNFRYNSVIQYAKASQIV